MLPKTFKIGIVLQIQKICRTNLEFKPYFLADYIIDNAYSYFLEHFCQDKPDVLCYGNLRIFTDGQALQDPQAQPDGEILFEGDGVDAEGLGGGDVGGVVVDKYAVGGLQ